MAEVTVILNGKTLVHGQGVKESIETSSEAITCFDEVVTSGSDVVSYKLDIDRLVFEKMNDYKSLSTRLEKMMKTPGTITTRQIIRYKGEKPWVLVKNYSGCILDGNEYEMKPEEHSAQNLSFICSDKNEYTEVLKE